MEYSSFLGDVLGFVEGIFGYNVSWEGGYSSFLGICFEVVGECG